MPNLHFDEWEVRRFGIEVRVKIVLILVMIFSSRITISPCDGCRDQRWRIFPSPGAFFRTEDGAHSHLFL